MGLWQAGDNEEPATSHWPNRAFLDLLESVLQGSWESAKIKRQIGIIWQMLVVSDFDQSRLILFGKAVTQILLERGVVARGSFGNRYKEINTCFANQLSPSPLPYCWAESSLRLTLSLPAAEVTEAEVMQAMVAAGTVATSGGAVMAVADMAADMAAHTVATTVRLTGLAAAFRCRCPLLVAGKISGAKIDEPEWSRVRRRTSRLIDNDR